MAQGNEAMLSIRDVCASYGEQQVIRSLSLDVGRGESFGLIGLNGTGKTTLIKTILGLKDQDSGAVSIGGIDSTQPESRQNLAYLPERFDPPWFLKGDEFLAFSVSLYGHEFDRAAAVALAEKLALDPAVLGRKVQTYSKGMRQKLGLIGTLLTGCGLMILDEPMSGLDPQARALVKDVLMQARAEGRTVFLSSHILNDMNEICDRVAVLSGGVLVFTGTPAQMLKTGGDPSMERSFLNIINPAKKAA